jgi:hypothetical protein
MSAPAVRVSREWLALREAADAAARACDLVDHLQQQIPATRGWVIHDLGCGTGAMGRWLAPLLAGPQHWVVHDHDPDLLEVASADVPGPAANGAEVTVEATCSDITRLRPADLAGATLITASALLDLFTDDELGGLVSVCAGAGCPTLLTLWVVAACEQQLELSAKIDGYTRKRLAQANAKRLRVTVEQADLLVLPRDPAEMNSPS